MRTSRIAAAALLLAASPAVAAAQSTTATAGGWSYAGPTGPQFWTNFDARCGGPRQSPVDLPAAVAAAPLGVRVGYARWQGRFVNNGHTVILPAGPGSTLMVADSSFALVELHFHVPAEHTVQGHRYAAEIHAVHQHARGARAVLGTFIAEGAHNPAWDAVIRAMPGNRDDSVAVTGWIDATQLMALHNLTSEPIYGYAGSLTTPGCDEDVRWMVRVAPIGMSREQVQAFASAMARNARPVQPRPAGDIRLHRGGP